MNGTEEVGRHMLREVCIFSRGWDEPAIRPCAMGRGEIIAWWARWREGGDTGDGEDVVRACVLHPGAHREWEVIGPRVGLPQNRGSALGGLEECVCVDAALRVEAWGPSHLTPTG